MRSKGITADLYPSPEKMKKQMKYANARKVPFVVLIGSEEMESGIFTLKNMSTGGQDKLSLEELITKFA
mgnify:CR=1 FL=1